MKHSVSRTSPAEVENSSSCKGILFRTEPGHHGRGFLHLKEALAWDFAQHVLDVFLTDLVEYPRFGRSRGNTVDGDIITGEFFAEGLGEGDYSGFCGTVWSRVGVAVLTGNGSNVDDSPVFS